MTDQVAGKSTANIIYLEFDEDGGGGEGRKGVRDGVERGRRRGSIKRRIMRRKRREQRRRT